MGSRDPAKIMGRRIKILHLIDSGGVYGAEVVLLNLMRQQRDKGHVVLLGSIGSREEGPKPIEELATSSNIRVIPFRMSKGYSLRGAMSILKFAHNAGIHVIHSHGYKSDILLGLMPKSMRRVPIISTLHGWTTTRRVSKMALYITLQKLCLFNVQKVVVVHTGMLGYLRKFHLDASVIENGIENLEFDPVYVARDVQFMRIASNRPLIGAIGRLSEEKGYPVLIRAIKIIRKKARKINAAIIGDGHQRDSLERLIARENLSECVFILGYRKQAYQYLPFFNIFILPSTKEGLPITVLEAMKAGTPIIASKVGGVPEVLEQGKAGILVRPGNPEELASAILTLLNSPQMARLLAENAQKRCTARYSVERMCERYLMEYHNLLGEKCSR